MCIYQYNKFDSLNNPPYKEVSLKGNFFSQNLAVSYDLRRIRVGKSENQNNCASLPPGAPPATPLGTDIGKDSEGAQIWKMVWGDLGARIGKCHKENVSYFSKDREGAQIGENGPGSPGAKNWQMS